MATPKPRKTGKPKALEDDEITETPPEQSLDDFLREMHQTSTQEQKFEGMPPLDWLKSKFKTKSGVIRYLIGKGFPKAAIAKHLGVKYQHVRNVSVQVLKRGPNEDPNIDTANESENEPVDES